MRGGRQWPGTYSTKMANFRISIFEENVAKLQYCIKFLFREVLFDSFIIIIMFWMKIVLLDHTKESAEVSNNDGEFKVNFYSFIKGIP